MTPAGWGPGLTPPPSDERGGPSAEGQLQSRALAESILTKARSAQAAGDVDGAVTLLQKAAVLFEAAGDHERVGVLLVECANAFMGVGEFRMALRFLDRARDEALASGLPSLKGEVYRGFGAYFKARGDLASAAVCYDRALEHLEGTSAGPSVSRALAELGEVYLKQARVPQAVAALRRAEQAAAPDDPALRVRLALNAGLIAFQAGNRKHAIDCYEEAAQDALTAGLVSERELVCIGLSALYEEEGRLDHALGLLREALALSVVACLRESQRALERQRLSAIQARLISIDARAGRAGPGFPHRREVEETVRLFDTHPFVVSGEVPQYGAQNAHVVPTALELSDGKLAWDLEEMPTQTLLNSAPDRAIWGKPPGRS